MVLSRFVLLATVFCAATAFADDAGFVMGTIAARGAGSLVVTEAGGPTVKVTLAPDAQISVLARHDFAEVAAGSVVCAATVVAPDGPASAMTLQIFPGGVPDPAHPPCAVFGGSGTVAGTVERVTDGAGYPTIEVSSGGATVLVVVAPATPIVTVAPGDAALLVAGAHVLAVGARRADGVLAADRVTVGVDGAVPGM